MVAGDLWPRRHRCLVANQALIIAHIERTNWSQDLWSFQTVRLNNFLMSSLTRRALLQRLITLKLRPWQQNVSMNADAMKRRALLCYLADKSKQTCRWQVRWMDFHSDAQLCIVLCAAMSKNSTAFVALLLSSPLSVPFSVLHSSSPPHECGVHFRVVQLVQKQLATVVLNISALFARMAMTAKRRDGY